MESRSPALKNLGWVAAAGVVAYGGWAYLRATNVTVVNAGEGSEYSGLIRRCKAVSDGYWPSLWSLHSALELLPFMWRNNSTSKLAYRLPHYIEDVEMEDGEILQIVWFRGDNTSKAMAPPYCDKTNTPILMVHHGAMCDSFNLPGQGYLKKALDRGWIVCALNRRGHGKKPLKVPKFQFFGSTTDLRDIVQFIRRTKRPAAPIYFIGLSSGSGLVAKFMGEQGQQLIDEYHPAFVNGAVAVCPGYNIEKCMSRMQWPYQQLLLRHAKEYFLCRNHALLKDKAGFCEMNDAKCLQSWLDNSYAISGYRSKDEFYLKTNPMETVQFIKDPMLVINSENDPICVAENVHENMDIFRSSQGATLVLTKLGSHLPFFELSWNPFRLESWAERLSFEYIEQVEQHRSEEEEARRLREENLSRLAPSPNASDRLPSTPGFAKQMGGARSPATPSGGVGFAKSLSASPSRAARQQQSSSSAGGGGEAFLNVESIEQLNASIASGASPAKAYASPVSVRSSNPSSPWSTVKSPSSRN